MNQAQQIAYGKYIHAEGAFIDATIKAYYPKWLIWIGEHRNWLSKNVISFVMAWPFRAERSRDTDYKSGKGFRPGHGVETLKSVTTRIYRGKKLVAERKFPINVQL